MNKFKTSEISRLGGLTSSILSGANLKQTAFLDQNSSTLTTPEEITSFLWDRLQGTWAGNKGWNVIALPSPGSVPTDKGDFKLLVQPYFETLTFTDAGAPARNRGGKVDQFISALEYKQHVSDKDNGELLHVENGMFLNLSEILEGDDKQPIPKFNVARSGTIPHGDSVMLLGTPPVIAEGAPKFPVTSSLPPDTGDKAPLGYLDPYLNANIKGLNLSNLNDSLQADLDEQKAEGIEVKETITVVLDSANSGGIVNVPFIKNFANASRFVSIFWLEKMVNTKTGQEFDQLQYTQIIDIDFHHKFSNDPEKAKELITWPHITINTMVKQ